MIKRLKYKKWKKVIEKSGLFDVKYYLFTYPDIRQHDIDPIMHYIQYGAKERRNPSAHFNTNYYLSVYQDIDVNKINPLFHYIVFGYKENRNPSGTFDTQFYLETHKDVQKKSINPLLHFMKYGQKEKRRTKQEKQLDNQKIKSSPIIIDVKHEKLREVAYKYNVGVVVHVYYVELWDEIYEYLNNISHNYTLYITTIKSLYEKVKTLKMPNVKVEIYVYDNVGYDIYPFLQIMKILERDNIDVFCKLHTKRGDKHTGKDWKLELINSLIGTDSIFAGAVSAFEKNSNLHMVGSSSFYKSIEYLLMNNKENITDLANMAHFDINNVLSCGFFAGTMFWGRLSHYTELFANIDVQILLSKQNNKSTISNSDGTLWHALERFLGVTTNKQSEVGLVYCGNIHNDYYLDILPSSLSACIRNNIGHSIVDLRNLSSNYKLIKNFRLFDNVKYLENFPMLTSSDVDKVLHYLKIGRFFVYDEINKELKTLFRYLKDSFVQTPQTYHELAVHGAKAPKYNGDDKTLEFQYLSTRMSILETHLIDWDIEKNKKRNNYIVSIVIPAYGQKEMTDECIASILRCNAGVEYEIVIVNNSQDESDSDSLEKWKTNPIVKVVNNEENLNFALGCNLGFSRSIGSIVVFLNNDTTVTDNWLIELIEPLNDSNISMTQPRLLYPDGSLQCMGLVFSNKSPLAYPIYQNTQPPKDILENNRTFKAVTGACLAIRYDDFVLARGFDTHYINGQEDVDLCLRLNNLKGTKALYCANSTVYHHEGKTLGRGKFVLQNRQLFVSRWKKSIEEDDTMHYNQDNVQVLEWQLDSESFKKFGVENHIPKVKFSETFLQSLKSNSYDDNFYIQGDNQCDKNKQNIMLTAHTLGTQIFGGERSFLDMVTSIDSSKYNIFVVLPNNSNREYIDILRKYVVSIYIVRYQMWDKTSLNEELIHLLESIIVCNNIKLLYANTIMCREALLAARNLGLKTAIHVRELINQDEHLRDAIGLDTQEILSELNLLSDYIIANSKITSQMFFHENKNLVYNKIDIKMYENITNSIQNNKVKFALISSNIPKKGINDFFEIAKICQKNKIDAEFLLIGPLNVDTQELVNKIEKHQLKNLKILGYFEDPLEAIGKANVILSLSHFAESFGRTVGESMAARRPVIAYNYGAIPELIEDGVDGYLCPYKNIDEVVKRIDYLCNNVSQIQILGNNAQKKITALSSEDVYKKAINEGIEKALKVTKNFKDKHIVKTAIIIPIYNAYSEVSNCIDSVLNTTESKQCDIFLINDGSTDERITLLLKKYKNISNHIHVIENETNMGYTKTVNKGIKLAKEKDVVLLNSDTIVTHGWLESLQDVAYRESKFGTVTAMSDNAGAFSFPKQSIANPKPKFLTHNNYAALVTRDSVDALDLMPIEVPTGSGFCFYIKKDLLKDIGLFDEVAFPRGYGEENDFCMRAMKHGWINVISHKTFIYHVRTASFGSEKEKLVKDGVVEVVRRFPDYHEKIQQSFGCIEMQNFRDAIQRRVLIDNH
ncbi:MAG: hypothetical protein KU38_01195 [Sulfurovum sp. FS08-3]|nr:MAG: hypothetical protein KU38_01195 [Sulfurovum sp. FS08-3]